MHQPTTMAQLARELKLSRLTVSSVLNNRYLERGISRETAARVQAYFQERGYVPSRQALDLRNPIRNSIGILHSGHFYSHVTEAFNLIVDRFNESPNRLEVMVVKPGAAKRGLQELVARGVSRLLWIHTRTPEAEIEDPETILPYLARMKAIIYNFRFNETSLEKRLAAQKVQMIGVDRAGGFRRLGEFLAKLGHRSVMVFSTEAGAGYARAAEGLLQAGLDVRFAYPEGHRQTGTQRDAIVAADILTAARKKHAVSAGCFLDDEHAGHTMAELLRRGVRVPQELTITGYNGMPWSEFTPVPLTTLSVPVAAMVKRLEELIHSDVRDVEHLFDLNLICRASHGRAETE